MYMHEEIFENKFFRFVSDVNKNGVTGNNSALDITWVGFSNRCGVIKVF
jgi:hypothetical protein